MRLFFYLVLVFLSLGAVSARSSEDLPHGDDVLALNRETFEGLKGKHDWVFMKMYAPWCGHCKRLVEDWSTLGSMFANTPVKIAAWNMEKDKEVANEFEVRGFPTLLLHNLKTGETSEPYRRSRKPEDMAKWIHEQTGIEFNKE